MHVRNIVTKSRAIIDSVDMRALVRIPYFISGPCANTLVFLGMTLGTDAGGNMTSGGPELGHHLESQSQPLS